MYNEPVLAAPASTNGGNIPFYTSLYVKDSNLLKVWVWIIKVTTALAYMFKRHTVV